MNNPEYERIGVNSGALPAGTTIEAETQADGSLRQVVKVGDSIQFDPSNMSVFGTLEVSDFTPIIQSDFVYGINTQKWNTAVISGTGAVVDADAGRLRIQSGTDAAGFAYIQTRKPVRYRAGQGMTVRYTPLFTAGAANNLQYWGMGIIASNIINDGYFLGYNGTAFGIAHYIRGVPTVTPQTSWNGDKCDGSAGSSFTYDPTKGTPVMIKYPFLGFGNIEFFIQNPDTSRWVLVHTIKYANTVATTQLSNPTLNFTGFTLNSGNTTNKIMYCGSIGAFISGIRSYVGNPKWAMNSSKNAITTETNIITLKNATTYNGVPNQGVLHLTQISVASTKLENLAYFKFVISPTLGGTPAYTTINGTTANNGTTITGGNSCVSFDVAGTTVTGGTYIFGIMLGSDGNILQDLTPQNIFVAPGETLTISATSAAAANIGVVINWTEDS
jgi:hypothetical protein